MEWRTLLALIILIWIWLFPIPLPKMLMKSASTYVDNTNPLPIYRIFQTIRLIFPPQIWEENGGASYSPNAAYLAPC